MLKAIIDFQLMINGTLNSYIILLIFIKVEFKINWRKLNEGVIWKINSIKGKAIRLYNTISDLKGYSGVNDITNDEMIFLKSYFILSNKAKSINDSASQEIEHNDILKQHIKLIIDNSNNFRNVKIKFLLNHCKETYFLEEGMFIKLCDEAYRNKYKY